MTSVRFVPISIAVGGTIVISVLGAAATRSIPPWAAALGWLVAQCYLAASTLVLVRGLRRRGITRLGHANVVTAVRSALVGVISGIISASLFASIPVWFLLALVVPTLLLDAVDGLVARRTSSASELGARFDMEVDAFLLFVLSAYVSQTLGIWVLAIGLMRYAFVVAGWIFPWMNRPLPFRYWRKVVTAVQGIALAVALAGLLPVVDAVVVAIALALLVESFGRDTVWLVVRRAADSDRPLSAHNEGRGDGEHENADGFDHECLRNKGEAPRHGDTE